MVLEPDPITRVGTVWVALYQATAAIDVPSATAHEVYEAQNTPHPLPEEEVENVLYDLWETLQIEVADILPGGILTYRFKSPTYATP